MTHTEHTTHPAVTLTETEVDASTQDVTVYDDGDDTYCEGPAYSGPIEGAAAALIPDIYYGVMVDEQTGHHEGVLYVSDQGARWECYGTC